MENQALVAQAVIDLGEQQTVIEVYGDATFVKFYTCWNVKDGYRTPILPRSKAEAKDIGDLAAKIADHIKKYSKRKVLGIHVQVFDEVAYQTLLTAAPDELGLTKLTMYEPRPMNHQKAPAWTEDYLSLQERMNRLFKQKGQ